MTTADSRARQSSLAFFLARAEQARAEGEASVLAHVRERCQRSEAAWQALANRAERSERLRQEEAVRKSEQHQQQQETLAESTAETRHEETFEQIGPSGRQDPR